MFTQDLTVAGEIVLLQRGRAQGTLRVEKSGELGDEAVALDG